MGNVSRHPADRAAREALYDASARADAGASRDSSLAGTPGHASRHEAKRSVAARSARAIPGSVAECPASGTTTKSASGQARCRSHAVMIGDRAHDIRAARMNGARAVGVEWGYGTHEELAAADAVAATPADLPRLLRELGLA